METVHRSIAIMHVPTERAARCLACPEGTSPHFQTHRIKYVTPLFRVEEDVCVARLFERQEHILLNDEPVADVPDDVIDRIVGVKLELLRQDIAELERENEQLATINGSLSAELQRVDANVTAAVSADCLLQNEG